MSNIYYIKFCILYILKYQKNKIVERIAKKTSLVLLYWAVEEMDRHFKKHGKELCMREKLLNGMTS